MKIKLGIVISFFVLSLQGAERKEIVSVLSYVLKNAVTDKKCPRFGDATMEINYSSLGVDKLESTQYAIRSFELAYGQLSRSNQVLEKGGWSHHISLYYGDKQKIQHKAFNWEDRWPRTQPNSECSLIVYSVFKGDGISCEDHVTKIQELYTSSTLNSPYARFVLNVDNEIKDKTIFNKMLELGYIKEIPKDDDEKQQKPENFTQKKPEKSFILPAFINYKNIAIGTCMTLLAFLLYVNLFKKQ